MKNRIRIALAEKEMNQRKLAELTGINEATISAIVRGSDTYLTTAKKIAKVLEKTIEELWPEDSNDTSTN